MHLMTLSLTVLLVTTALGHVITRQAGPPPPADPQVCQSVSDEERFDCFPEDFATTELCAARGCCWVPRSKAAPLDVPWCFYPPGYQGYSYKNLTNNDNGQVAYLERQITSPYPDDVALLKLEVEYQTDTRVRVKISDANVQRYESPYPKISQSKPTSTKARQYTVNIDQSKSGFQIFRSSGELLFDGQNKGGFIFADQFLQFSAGLVGSIYGLGEHRTALQLNTTWTRLAMLAHDTPPTEDINEYGVQPFYLAIEPNGRSHGVLLINSDPGEIILQPIPAITYRFIGGILDFYFFTGPTPAEVVSQLQELIGRPSMPPFWSLGFHLCRYGYPNLQAVRDVYDRTRAAGIPYDVQWTDIEYMKEYNDFTVDHNAFAQLPQFINELHDNGMRFVPILDAGISANEPAGTFPAWDRGLSMDVLLKNDDDSIFVGKVWNPVSTAFPDYLHPRAVEYYTGLLQDLHDEIAYDGIWIDMNEPANMIDGQFSGCPDTRWDNPPYVPAVNSGKLYYKTACMSAKHAGYRHYDVHNLFGISHADVTSNGLATVMGQKRSFVLSRSTFVGSGQYTGHWSGDNLSGWHDLTKSMPEILSFSIFGIPYMGADICGFRDNSWESLCNRWMQLGAFYPFSRNHNAINTVDQDPAAWGGLIVNSSKKYLNIRYTLLPYLYTLFYRAHVYGETVARPLFFEFADDPNTHPIDRAFLWGSGLYIVPVTEDVSTSVSAYLPQGRWYDYITGSQQDSNGKNVVLDAPVDTIPLLVRGGNILPTQAPSVTTTLSRKNPFSLLVAADSNNKASGSLFWDDGETAGTIENDQYGLVNFVLDGSTITSEVVQWNTEVAGLDSITIYGASSVTSVQFNGQDVEYKFDSSYRVLKVTGLNGKINETFTLTWS